MDGVSSSRVSIEVSTRGVWAFVDDPGRPLRRQSFGLLGHGAGETGFSACDRTGLCGGGVDLTLFCAYHDFMPISEALTRWPWENPYDPANAVREGAD